MDECVPRVSDLGAEWESEEGYQYEDDYRADAAQGGAEEQESSGLELQMRLLELEAELRQARAQLASSRAMTEMLQISLIESGAREFQERDEDIVAPLLMAARSGDLQMLDVLLSAPSTSPAERNTALLVASQHGQTAAAARLLDGGASVHADHDSALLWACKTRNAELVRLLLERGADPGALHGCAMRIAVRSGDTAVARLLLGLQAPEPARDAQDAPEPARDAQDAPGAAPGEPAGECPQETSKKAGRGGARAARPREVAAKTTAAGDSESYASVVRQPKAKAVAPTSPAPASARRAKATTHRNA